MGLRRDAWRLEDCPSRLGGSAKRTGKGGKEQEKKTLKQREINRRNRKTSALIEGKVNKGHGDSGEYP